MTGGEYANAGRGRQRQPNNSAYTEKGGAHRGADFYHDADGEYTRAYGVDRGRRQYGRRDNRSSIASKGREKVGEARRAAQSRRRFIEKRRGLLLALSLLIMTVLILSLVYKLVFVVRDISVVGGEIYSSDAVLEHSGVSPGVNLYSFRASMVKSKVSLYCPYIKDVEIDRNIPSTVVLNISEDSAVYYANIFGEIKLLSSELRVLETVADVEAVPDGLIKLKLPTVSYSVSGREIEFADENAKSRIDDILINAIQSDVSERLTAVDLRDPYELVMFCDSRIKLVLGNADKLSRKLSTAAAVMKDDMFTTDNKFIVDLTIDGKTGVRIDNLMETD